MGARIRSKDWEATPFGPPERWPQSLRLALAICLHSSFPTAIYWGPEFRLLYNDAWASVPGDRHPWALGRPGAEVWHDIWDVVGPQFEQVRASGEGLSTYDEMLLMVRDGAQQETYWNYSLTPIRAEDGTIVGILNQGHETTDRVFGERRRAAEAERQRRLFQQAPGFITILNGPDHRFEFVNDAYVRLFGDRQFVGKTVRGAFPELEGQGFLEWLDHVYATGERFVASGVPARLETTDAPDERSLDFIYAPVTNDEGAVTGIFCEGYDVTDAHRGRAHLAINEERMRLATEAAEVGFWDDDVVNNRLIWQPIVKAMFGILAEEPVTMEDFYTGLHPDDRERTSTAYALACDPVARSRYDVEYRTIGKEDGRIRWVAAKGRALFDDKGQCVRVTGTAVDITERKAADEQRAAQAEELRAIIEAVPAAIWIARDPECREIIGNQVANTVLRMPANANMSKSAPEHQVPTHFRVFGADGCELAPDAMPVQRAARGEAVRDFEQRVVFDDGSHLDLFGNATPLRRPNGEAWGAIGAFMDVTGPKQAETALRESEGRFRDIADAAPVLIWISDITKACTWFNRPWLEFTGRTMEEELGYGWAEGVHADDFDRCVTIYNDAFDRRVPFRMDYRLKRHDGEYRIIDDSGVPRLAEDGSFLGFIGACVDVTDARKAEGALRDSEERFRQLAEAVEQVFYVTELDERRLSYLSPSYERVWGRSPQEVLEDLSSFFETIHPDDRLRVAALEEDQQAGEARELVYRIVRPDGSVRWIHDRFFPVPSADGRVHRSVGLAEDITERKLLQDALRELNETLEQRVVERTAELQHAQEALRQSQKLEAMGQLMGGVAHDFNNLLTPIIGSLDMLQQRQFGDERAQRQINGALQSAERAKTLVQRLLAFARRQPLQKTAVDVGRLISGMADLIASTSGPQVKLAVDIQPDLPPAQADANQVEMALLNLAVNSRDAMRDGGKLTISATAENVGPMHRAKLPVGCYIRLAVSDTGTGMDEVTLARAIEPFFSTKGIGQGTGLGLSMVHGLASQLGGALTIQSRLGLGTTVELWLPSTVGLAAEQGPSQTTGHSRGVGTALVVDDEDLVRASTADMLSDMGFSVVEASSAEGALALIKEGLVPEALITDHLMPGMTGTDLARAALQRLPQLTVLIVSGYAEDTGIAADLPRLTKPFRQADLAASLGNLMKPAL